MKGISFIFLISLLTACCQSFTQKFDKSKWMEEKDLQTFPYRDNMLNDLTTNYKIKGLTYNQLIDLIGKPQYDMTKDREVCYQIKTEYGWNIDPVYLKNFVITLNNDSIVVGFKTYEWKK